MSGYTECNVDTYTAVIDLTFQLPGSEILQTMVEPA